MLVEKPNLGFSCELPGLLFPGISGKYFVRDVMIHNESFDS
jgi:hypothetical protein